MTEDIEEGEGVGKLKFNFASSMFVSAYCVFVGICYQLGFWVPLKFDILPFLSPIDLMKLATYPVMVMVAATIVTTFANMYIVNSGHKEIKEEKGNPVVKWTYIIFLMFNIGVTLYIAGIVLYHFFTAGEDEKIKYGLLILSYLLGWQLISNPKIKIFEDKVAQGFLLLYLCLLPAGAYGFGDRKINQIIKGEASYYYLSMSTDNCEVEGGSRFVYLGKFGEVTIFYNSIFGNICIESNQNLNLKYYVHPTKKPVDE